MPPENDNTVVSEVSPDEKKTATTDFLAEYNAKLKDLSQPIKDKLVQTLVARKVDECVDLLDKALKKRMEMNGALKKFKPDQQQFDGEGKVVSETYSKSKYEELKKAKEQLQKMDKALDLAFGGDYAKLKEAMNSGSGGDKSENKEQK